MPIIEKVRGLSRADATRPLLDALDDPDRWVAAHLWLSTKHKRGIPGPGRWEGEKAFYSFYGLDITLNIVEPSQPSDFAHQYQGLDDPRFPGPAEMRKRLGPFVRVICTGSNVHIDPSQLPRIRRTWHDLLDVQILAVPYSLVIALLLVPVFAYAWFFRRRRRLLHAIQNGVCTHCGYDLRQSPARCPECGHEAAQI